MSRLGVFVCAALGCALWGVATDHVEAAMRETTGAAFALSLHWAFARWFRSVTPPPTDVGEGES